MGVKIIDKRREKVEVSLLKDGDNFIYDNRYYMLLDPSYFPFQLFYDDCCPCVDISSGILKRMPNNELVIPIETELIIK